MHIFIDLLAFSKKGATNIDLYANIHVYTCVGHASLFIEAHNRDRGSRLWWGLAAHYLIQLVWCSFGLVSSPLPGLRERMTLGPCKFISCFSITASDDDTATCDVPLKKKKQHVTSAREVMRTLYYLSQ
jgi:hypothetical protein